MTWRVSITRRTGAGLPLLHAVKPGTYRYGRRTTIEAACRAAVRPPSEVADAFDPDDPRACRKCAKAYRKATA